MFYEVYFFMLIESTFNFFVSASIPSGTNDFLFAIFHHFDSSLNDKKNKLLMCLNFFFTFSFFTFTFSSLLPQCRRRRM